MPLPIGHTLAGMAFFEARPGLFFKNKWVDAFFIILLANLPDADFLPGLLLGFPNRYHHGVFHSLGAALAVTAISGLIFLRAKQHAWRLSALVFLIFSSHLLFDFFTRDFTAPFGLPLFWPFSKNYYIAAHPIFFNITRSDRSADFFSSLFSAHNVKAALLEIGLLGSLALLTWIIRRLVNRNTSGSRSR